MARGNVVNFNELARICSGYTRLKGITRHYENVFDTLLLLLRLIILGVLVILKIFTI